MGIDPTNPHGLMPGLDIHKEVPLADLKLPEPKPAGEPASITYEDFLKIDLRVGEVLAAERVPKSTKLIKMRVSFGDFERQILAGVGLTFEPGILVGQSYVFVVNLPPRKMMGLESHGMMLAAGEPEALSLVKTFVPVGSRLG